MMHWSQKAALCLQAWRRVSPGLRPSLMMRTTWAQTKVKAVHPRNRWVLTSTNVEDTSGNPPDDERGKLWPGREYTEQGVDDVFLARQDGDQKIGDDCAGNLSGVRLVSRRETDEYGNVGREDNTEKSSANREQQIAEVSDRLGVLLLDILLVEKQEHFSFVGNILRRVVGRSRSRDTYLGFHSGMEANDLGFPRNWSREDNGFTAARK